MKYILSEPQIQGIVKRLGRQIAENHLPFSETVIIGLQPRGVWFAKRIVHFLVQEFNVEVPLGFLDITFYRDDIRESFHLANKTTIPFSTENKRIILVDDVLFTGRTIRAAFDALLDFGRPKQVELAILIDRRFSREFPIQPTYTGKAIDTFKNEKVMVKWKENFEEDVVYIENNNLK